MLKMELTGNLVRDPETGTTETGVNWCQFVVAVNRRKLGNAETGKPETEYVRVTAWRSLGDTCAKYLRKGRKVYVYTKDPRVHAWVGSDGNGKGEFRINADEVEFLSPAERQDRPTDADAPPDTDPQSGMTQVEDPDDPF